MSPPGYGERHPDVAAFLAEREPDDLRAETWTTPGLRFMVASYLGTRLPPVLLGSARCIVWEAGSVVVCSTPDGPSITPGGRLEAGEEAPEAACREVYEETGRTLRPADLTYLGIVHYEHRDPMRAGFPYPYPDFFQAIYTAAVEPDVHGSTAGWAESADDGWVLGHWLATEDELAALPITETERFFLAQSRRR